MTHNKIILDETLSMSKIKLKLLKQFNSKSENQIYKLTITNKSNQKIYIAKPFIILYQITDILNTAGLGKQFIKRL